MSKNSKSSVDFRPAFARPNGRRQKAAARITIDRKLADGLYRESFGAFTYAAYSIVNSHESLVENWHIDCLCYRMGLMGRFHAGEPLPANFTEFDLKRLVINLPPRSLKSYIVSVAWIAWLLGRDPSLEIICKLRRRSREEIFSRLQKANGKQILQTGLSCHEDQSEKVNRNRI